MPLQQCCRLLQILARLGALTGGALAVHDQLVHRIAGRFRKADHRAVGRPVQQHALRGCFQQVIQEFQRLCRDRQDFDGPWGVAAARERRQEIDLQIRFSAQRISRPGTAREGLRGDEAGLERAQCVVQVGLRRIGQGDGNVAARHRDIHVHGAVTACPLHAQQVGIGGERVRAHQHAAGAEEPEIGEPGDHAQMLAQHDGRALGRIGARQRGDLAGIGCLFLLHQRAHTRLVGAHVNLPVLRAFAKHEVPVFAALDGFFGEIAMQLRYAARDVLGQYHVLELGEGGLGREGQFGVEHGAVIQHF